MVCCVYFHLFLLFYTPFNKSLEYLCMHERFLASITIFTPLLLKVLLSKRESIKALPIAKKQISKYNNVQQRNHNSPISVFQAKTHIIHAPRFFGKGSSCGLDT